MLNDYYLYCVVLKNCPYSQAAHELLNSYKNIKKDFTFIERSEMENYKTELINTFPQIYLKRYNTNGTKLIGGYTDFKNIIDTFKAQNVYYLHVTKYSDYEDRHETMWSLIENPIQNISVAPPNSST